MSMDLDLDALQALADAATPGPWKAVDIGDAIFDSGNHKGFWYVWQDLENPYYAGVMEMDRRHDPGDPAGSAIGCAAITDFEDGEREQADAEYIAAACNAIPELIERVRSAEAYATYLAKQLLDGFPGRYPVSE